MPYIVACKKKELTNGNQLLLVVRFEICIGYSYNLLSNEVKRISAFWFTQAKHCVYCSHIC